MNRREWYLFYRQSRIDKPKNSLTIGELTEVLKEIYDYYYTPKQEVFIRLVNRYANNLNKSYFDKIESWKPKAKKKARDQFRQLIYSSNPLFEMIPKDDDFKGKYVPIPITYRRK